MASSNFLFPEGNSINRPPIFNGEGYHYWKSRMKIFIEAIDLNIWDVVENGSFIPTIVVGHEIKDLPKDQWSDDDRRKFQYNLKAKNIITSALGIDEYFRISNCKNAKEMWDTLKITHEGTNDVKRSRKNTLIHEYELFRMNQNESIQDMQLSIDCVLYCVTRLTNCTKKSISNLENKISKLNNLKDFTNQTWYIDSGCSKHMTGDASKFIDLTPKRSGHVTYGDNNRGKILGIGKIGTNFSISIENVLLVDGLKHSLLSVSQLCDKGFSESFDSQKCLIKHKNDKNVKIIGFRVNNVYKIKLENNSNNSQCLMSKEDESWLWHKRMAHINIEHLNKLISKDLVIGLPKIKFEKNKLCDACQKGKQVKVSFKPKNIVTTSRPLELLHMDVKSAFLNGFIQEEVYVEQPPSFENSEFTNHVFKLKKKEFTHIINHLASLGKVFPNEDLINKVLRCLSREWQPKVTAIAESKDLTTMSLASLFGKLQEHEMELIRLNQYEESDKRKKGITLKTSSFIQEKDEK
uniref:Copia protein n=1 Tax=Cajanus cajan TaxID=3821 RepID=A0A151RE09_CAJCA|nr:Copia protein [Cajanus cajan]